VLRTGFEQSESESWCEIVKIGFERIDSGRSSSHVHSRQSACVDLTSSGEIGARERIDETGSERSNSFESSLRERIGKISRKTTRGYDVRGLRT